MSRLVPRIEKLSEDVYIEDSAIQLANGYSFTVQRLYALTYLYQEVSALRQTIAHQDDQIRLLQEYMEGWRVQAGVPIAANDVRPKGLGN